VRVERVIDASALLEHREAVERYARTGLEEPSFDLAGELARDFGVAFAAWGPAPSPVGVLMGWRVADELHILSVVVDSQSRRLGAGRALTHAAIEHARELGMRLVLLEVRRDNTAAIRLYRSLGFLAVRVRRAYYANGDDGVEMGLGLVEGALAELLPDSGEPSL
jgi:ribosomal protein S18 acetylase RimI-like enzyme